MKKSELIATFNWVEKILYVNDEDDVAIIAFTSATSDRKAFDIIFTSSEGKSRGAPYGVTENAADQMKLATQAVRTAVHEGANEAALMRAVRAVHE